MDDLSICKRIAEIEGFESTQCGNVECAENHYIRVSDYADGTKYYNPLTDDALCFQLMVKYDVERTYEPYDCLGWYCRVINSVQPTAILEINCTSNGLVEISPNKAICLAIIEAHKES